MYVLYKMYVCMEIDEDEKVDDIGRIVNKEIEELYVFGERDGFVLEYSNKDVVKKSKNFEDLYELDER